MLLRTRLKASVVSALARSPVAALLGPRQCGKTTLALDLAAPSPVTVFDLEDPGTLAAFEHPRQLLAPLTGLIVIDEVQRRRDLFPLLRVLADRRDVDARFLLLGSASPDLMQESSESLAGRIAFVEMSGFDLTEVGAEAVERLWTRGGFPRSFLAADEASSFAWRDDFARTFLERDLFQLGLSLPPVTMRRFWTMAAHYHGQTWNSAQIASALGVNDTTARRYLDILAGAYMLRVLPPWFENVGKRQRKAPKAYFRDSGMLHTLLGLRTREAMLSHPKAGASWEGFALEQILRVVPTRDAYYWAVHGGPELDLLLLVDGKRLGFEFKLADAPRMTSSLRTARRDLALDELLVVFPGERSYELDEGVRAVPLVEVVGELAHRFS